MTEAQRDTNTVNERLADTFYKSGRYTPVFLLIAGIGILVIYALNAFGILGEPAPKLLTIGLLIVGLAFAQWMIFILLARRNKGIAAYFWATLSVAVFAISLTYSWQNVVYFSIALILIVPINGWLSGMPRKNMPWLILLVLACITAAIYFDTMASNSASLDRLQLNSSVAVASLAFLGATSLLLIAITIISQNRNFKSLQGLLLTTFVVIVTIPTIMATVLSGVGAYSNSQAQTFNTLKAISSLKEAQISLLLDEIKNDADKIQGDVRFKQNIVPVLTAGEDDPEQTASYRALARAFMLSIQRDKGTYTEILILNTKGTVVLSTDFAHANVNYEDQLFFRQGTVKFFTGFADVSDFGSQNFIAATPLFDTNGQVIRGVIVLRSDASAIKQIMETTPGYVEAETYLVDKNYLPVTKIRSTAEIVRTKAALDAILENTDGQATYKNYADQDVLGYYKWYEPMQMAIIAELPVETVLRTSLASLWGSSLLALLVIIIAIAAVAVATRSIADPIRELVGITESYAAGKFHVRANVNRKDEIGALASSYNQMAAELQDIIGKLEQRVTDRTRELESQTLRVRVAAEIARDAAAAHNLGELLESFATLLLERFKFYHTGIFLIDKNREFAVLTASPTEAGERMITDGYKLRVGEAGLVGRVASTGEPRISLDAGQDMVRFNNPLLPNTQSEMALPLKVGNMVIGVLDVQSDLPKAFSQDDIAILQVMADQLATAIERTRLLQEVEYNLRELEKAYGQYTREGWQRVGSSGHLINRGYRFDNIRIEPINRSPEIETEVSASSDGDSPNGGKGRNTVAIPIKLRGQTIGVISAKLKEGYSSRTVSTLEAATERLAAALESARLYEEARARADREQSIAQVTSKISASTEFETILRTTVEEIGKSISNSEVSIQIVGDLDNQE
jgi:GAF domain-containing protein/HAMP domain-containing protein